MRITRLVLAVGLAAGVLVTVNSVDDPVAEAVGLQWFDGNIVYSEITNCVSIIQGAPYSEAGAGTFVGFQANPEASQPAPNQVYYVRVVVAALGNACSGQRAQIEIDLPPNTTTAISGTNPVRCFYDSTQLSTSDCPQTLPPGPLNAGHLWVPSSDAPNLNTWPLPIGKQLQIQIPVVSTAVLSGAPLDAAVLVLDGNSSPTLRPRQGVFVFSGTPTVLAPSPSTTFGSTTWPTTIRSEVYLYPVGQGGNGYFELRTVSGGPAVYTDGPAVIPAGQGNGYIVWSDWTTDGVNLPGVIQPDTTYFWRFRFESSSGPVYFGPEQSWRSPPANRAIVGTGTAASCTGAAVAAAVASGQPTISFSCGTSPVMIQLTAEAVIGSGRTIDGDDLVTLRAPAGSRALRFTGGSSTLRDIALTGGNATGCGGGVWVSGGSLSVDGVRIHGNAASTSGGGLCVTAPGTASIGYASITGNTAGSVGGGVSSSGDIDLNWSDVSDNTAATGGGGIVTTAGFLDIRTSAIVANRAGTNGDGGGVFATGSASPSLINVTVSGNTARRGGGMFSQSTASFTLASATISANTSTTVGAGALENDGAAGSGGFVVNTIVAGNTPSNCNEFYRFFTSQGHNLDGANRCGFGAAGDLVDTDPLLRPLALWGGPSRTHALRPGSPALDAGANVNCGQFDQRGVGIDDGGFLVRWIHATTGALGICDIGAYELQPEAMAPQVTAVGRASVNPTSAATVSWTVSFSETVTGFGAADVAIVATGVSGSTVGTVTPSGPSSVYTVSVALGGGMGTVRLDVVDDNSVVDALNNPLVGPSSANGAFVGEAYDVTRPVAPTTTVSGGTVPGGTVPGGTVPGGTVPGGTVPGGAARSYVPLAPARVLETRSVVGSSTIDGRELGSGVVGAGVVRELPVWGRGGVSGDAAAVVLNVAAIGASDRGYATVFPCGGEPPTAANINFVAGDVVSNAVVVKVGSAGRVCIFSSAASHFAVDVGGYFPSETG